MPFGRTYMHDSKKSPLRGQMYHHREIAFERAIVVCMHYRIFIANGGFEPTCVTLACFALQFHEFTGGF